MHSILIGLAVFATIFGAAQLGMILRRKIPDTHLGSDAKDVIRLVTGITATTSALVLGMLVSSSKNYYDSWNTQIAEVAAQIVAIDHLMASYGPETTEIRAQFHDLTEAAVERIWPQHDPLQVALKPRGEGEILVSQLEALTPKNATQASVKSQLFPLVSNLRQAQLSMFVRTKQTSMPMPLLVIVVSWQATIFISMALFAPPNPTIHVTFALGALVVSTAVFIILEMYSPFKGILSISATPITDALSQMQH